MDALVSPLPRLEVTPPVTKMYFAIRTLPGKAKATRSLDVGHPGRGHQEALTARGENVYSHTVAENAGIAAGVNHTQQKSGNRLAQ